jgi:protein-S-isoprenylcysteine O-methyltransferase Ste14
MTASRIPPLGPRGEGWLLLQVALMVAIPLAAWRASALPDPDGSAAAPARALGAIALLAGLALIALSSWLLNDARAFSTLPRPRDDGQLVERGPYRWIRHPIYVGLILAGAGTALIRVSPLVGLLAVALTVVLDLKRRREEAWLLDRYPAYAAYRARTRAFVPFLY